jgi:hypothetical protein
MAELESLAALEHHQLLIGMDHQLLIGTDQLWALHESQLWAKMSMDKTTNAKLQIKWLMTKYESQQWAEMCLGLKQYHKGQA